MNPTNIKKLNINLWELKNRKNLIKYEKNFNEFVKNKINLNFKKITCPCGLKRKKVLIKKFNSLNYYKCDCKTIYLNPTITAKNLNEIYKNNGIYEKYRNKILYENKAKKVRKIINKRKVLQILELFKNRKNFSILDYGCGDGEFLNHLSMKVSEKNLFGFDLNTNLKKTKNNIKIYSKISDLKNKQFDLITLWGVLEHINEPDSLIKFLAKITKKHGFIVIEVPSSESLLSQYTFSTDYNPIRWFEPYRHLFFFSLECLKKIFKNRFSLKYIETNGLDLQTIFNNENQKYESKIISSQKKINDDLIGDHYRIFFKRK